MHRVDKLLLQVYRLHGNEASSIMSFIDSVETGEHSGEWEARTHVFKPKQEVDTIENYYSTQEEAHKAVTALGEAYNSRGRKIEHLIFITDYGEMA